MTAVDHDLEAAILVRTPIAPSRGWRDLELRSVWAYRQLVYFLTWRDLKVRYRQTVLGVAWVLLQPLLTMVVFSLIFGRVAKIPSEGVPYPIFSFAALLPWTFFSNAILAASMSVVASSAMITKVYFPRLLLPLAAVGGTLVDFVLSFVVFAGLMAYYGVVPPPRVVLLPLLVLLAVAAPLGLGMLLAALNVRYRDVRYVVPFLVQFWLFLTPVVYPASLLGEPWRSLIGLNPMTGVVEGFRWALLGTHLASPWLLPLSATTAALSFAGGLVVFRQVEDSFADVV